MKFFFVIFFIAIVSFSAAAQKVTACKITDLEATIKAPSNKIKVINFWATFCNPCVAELPYFLQLQEAEKDKVELILVSLDFKETFPKKIAAFAKKNKIKATMLWLNETNADYFCPKIDTEWSGSIPATLIVNTATGYRYFVEGEMTKEALAEQVKKAGAL